jgi:hypothetical protein
VILDDAREALRLRRQWLEEDHLAQRPKPDAPDYRAAMHAWTARRAALDAQIARLAIAAEERAAFEEMTLADLRAAGFEVHRMAGVFEPIRAENDRMDEAPESRRMNFMNAVLGTGAGDEKFGVYLGGDPRAEAYVRRKLLQEIPTGLARVHFLDREASAGILEAEGGIACLTKLDRGRVVSPHEARPQG